MASAHSTADLRSQLRKAMDQQKWTEADVARKANVPQSTVKRFLAGSEPLYCTGCKYLAVIASAQ